MVVGLGALIVFFAAALQGFSGFGFALLSIPLVYALCFDFDLQIAIIFCNATFWFHSLLMSWRVRDRVRFQDASVVAAGVIAGVLAAGPVFGQVGQKPVFVYGFGTFLIVLACIELYRKAKPELGTNDDPQVQHSRGIPDLLLSFVFGGLTGLIGVLAGTTGPPLLIYGKIKRWDEDRIRAFVQPVFLFTAIAACVSYWSSSEKTTVAAVDTLVTAMSPRGEASLWAVAIFLCLSVGLGTLLGWKLKAICDRRGRPNFRLWFYVVILCLGILMIVFEAYRNS